MTKQHIERFKAIQGFLGGCVNNIGNLSMSISTLLGLISTLDSCHESVRRIESDPESNMTVFRQLFTYFDAARVISDKMTDS
jgi:hypothetical protein